jgi:hypothetical protein
VQATLQLAALPVMVSIVHALLSSQVVGHVLGGSQVSPAEITPSPHLGEQSLSLPMLQPAGQQPSSFAQAVIGSWVQATLQVAAVPVMMSLVHATPSSQLVGHVLGRSQVSGNVTTPSPHATRQSLSLLMLQSAGQQRSCTVPLHTVIGVYVHLA